MLLLKKEPRRFALTYPSIVKSLHTCAVRYRRIMALRHRLHPWAPPLIVLMGACHLLLLVAAALVWHHFLLEVSRRRTCLIALQHLEWATRPEPAPDTSL